MLDYIDVLNLDNSIKQRIIDLARQDRVNVLMCADACNSGDFSCLEDKDDMFRLAVICECLTATKAEYERLGISDEIFADTMSDIKIWCENNSNSGISNYGWLKNHLTCQLFRIGRLQYQLYVCENDTLNFGLLPFE